MMRHGIVERLVVVIFSRTAALTVLCSLCAVGCDSEEKNLGTNVQHDRPVQVSPSNPVANASQRPGITSANVIVVQSSTGVAEKPKADSPSTSGPIANTSRNVNAQEYETAQTDDIRSTGSPNAAGPNALTNSTTPQATNTSDHANRALWRELDESKIAAAGIRRLESRRLVLYTDVPSAPEIDDFPQAFDQAFELWCKYFGLDANKYPDWRIRASLIADEARFKACGLIPDDLPKFYNGYTRGHECWLYNQTSTYYRRHLLLHEGVHGFMFSLLGSKAPPWYIEGMAELLGTHDWENGQLELPYFPKNPAETPKLERIDIIQHDFAKHQARQLLTVMAFGGKDYFQVEPYGWSWALAAFLDGHPHYRDRFHKLPALFASKWRF